MVCSNSLFPKRKLLEDISTVTMGWTSTGMSEDANKPSGSVHVQVWHRTQPHARLALGQISILKAVCEPFRLPNRLPNDITSREPLHFELDTNYIIIRKR